MQTAKCACEPANNPRTAIDHHTVDDRLITELPEARAHRTRTTGEEDFVESVEVVLVVEQSINTAKALAEPGRHRRVDQVAVIGRDHPCQREPERHRGQRVCNHANRTVEFLFQDCHRVVGLEDRNRGLEEVTEKHRADGEHADQHRGNRQQHQRQGDHRGAFMRQATVVPAIMAITVAVAMAVGVPMSRGMRIGAETLLAMEHQEIHAKGIEGGHEHASQHREIGKARGRQRRGLDRLDDHVFRIEARKEGCADQGQRAEQRGDPGDRHVFAQATHIPDVLVMVHADNHRAGRQKEQRLEKRMRHQMKDRDAVGRGTERHGHVAELRQCGVGNHPLDVVLDDAEKAHEKRSDRADGHDKRQRGIRELEKRRHARHHEDARSDHGCCVNECRDRGRAFH